MIETINDTVKDSDDDVKKVARFVTHSSTMKPAVLRKVSGDDQSFVGFGVFGIGFAAVAGLTGHICSKLTTELIEDSSSYTSCSPVNPEDTYFTGENAYFTDNMQQFCTTHTGALDMLELFGAIALGLLTLLAVLLSLSALFVTAINLRTRLALVPEGTVVTETDSLRWAFARHFLETEALRRGANRGSVLSRTGDWIQKTVNFVHADADILKEEDADESKDPAIWEVFKDAVNGIGDLGEQIDGSVSRFVIETEKPMKILSSYQLKLSNGRRLLRASTEMEEIAAAELSPIVDILMREVFVRQELAQGVETQRELQSHTRREVAKLWR